MIIPKTKLLKTISFLFFLICINISAQEIIELYPGPIPNSKESDIKEVYKTGFYAKVTTPTLELFTPEKEKASGKAIIICPGGGYGVVVYNAEGVNTAKEFV
ncbi:MAG: hypothetical protein OQJ81_05390, partial [Melioribacteraceae bacterium]|nr:hypothetical protein [Melioribacteraceae bacterium]